jgi:hypothetical protein
LKINLKINKEMIEGMLSSQNNKDKNTCYMSKMKEENEKLSRQLDQVLKEKDEIRNKVISINHSWR